MKCLCEQGIEGEVLKIDSRRRYRWPLIPAGTGLWSALYDLFDSGSSDDETHEKLSY